MLATGAGVGEGLCVKPWKRHSISLGALLAVSTPRAMARVASGVGIVGFPVGMMQASAVFELISVVAVCFVIRTQGRAPGLQPALDAVPFVSRCLPLPGFR